MRLSVGMLAYNEERGIATALRSLLRQTVLDEAHMSRLGIDYAELVCVANGCRDRTVAVIEEVFREVRPRDGLALRVVDLPEPGKSGAWNRYVHEFSDPDADLIVLVDADIELGDEQVVEKLVRLLEVRPEVDVATDVPLKRFRQDGRLSLRDLASRQVSEDRLRELPHSICGQLYCARAAVLRQIWMPHALPVEDGFLSAFVMTAGFSRPPRETAICRVRDAVHYYEPVRGIAEHVRHETRIIVGSVINAWVFDRLGSDARNESAGANIRRWNEEDPDWVDVLSRRHGTTRRWLVPSDFMWWRLNHLSKVSRIDKIKGLPLATAATILNLMACFRANRALRSENPSKTW